MTDHGVRAFRMVMSRECHHSESARITGWLHAASYFNPRFDPEN